MFKSLKIFFCRLGVFLYVALRIYSFKSKIYRFLFERKYNGVMLSTYPDFDSLAAFTNILIYKADSWLELFDAISTPQYVQWVGLNGGQSDKLGFDCDEFAIYIANAIAKSLETGTWKDKRVQNPKMMTIVWMRTDGSVGGHNVCAFEWKLDNKVVYSYMDYGLPSAPVESKAHLAFNIRAKYAGDDNTSLGWSLHNKDLRVLEAHWS